MPKEYSREPLIPNERCLEIKGNDVLNSLQKQKGVKAIALDHIPDTVFAKKTVAKYIYTFQEKPAQDNKSTLTKEQSLQNLARLFNYCLRKKEIPRTKYFLYNYKDLLT